MAEARSGFGSEIFDGGERFKGMGGSPFGAVFILCEDAKAVAVVLPPRFESVACTLTASLPSPISAAFGSQLAVPPVDKFEKSLSSKAVFGDVFEGAFFQFDPFGIDFPT